MIPEIEEHTAAIADLCRRYRVRELKLFGSAATGNFIPAESDLDFLADFADTQATDYPDRYLDLAEGLEHLFNRPVDIVTKQSIRNRYFRSEVERTAQVVYEDNTQETPT